MASFTAKRGDMLSDYEARLYDRHDVPLDLTNADVFLYMREDGETENYVDGDPCAKLDATGGEAYPQRVSGPPVELTDEGDFKAYFKVVYGSTPLRIPSDGYLWFKVEPNFEP